MTDKFSITDAEFDETMSRTAAELGPVKRSTDTEYAIFLAHRVADAWSDVRNFAGYFRAHVAGGEVDDAGKLLELLETTSATMLMEAKESLQRMVRGLGRK